MFLCERWAKTMLTPRRPGGEAGRVGPDPRLGPRVEVALLPRGEAAQHDAHASRRLADVDPVVQVPAERQRQLVEQQILRRQVGIFRQAMEVRIVAVHVSVQALHDVGKGLNVRHLGLFPEPRGERLDLAEIGGIGDLTLSSRLERIFQGLDAGQVLDDEVRILPELVALAQVPGPVVGQLEPGECR